MSRRHHHRLRSERGQAVVEFALVAPLLLVLILGIAQAGVAFNHYLTVTDAARAAAREAVVARVSDVSVAQIKQTAVNAATDLDQSKLAVNVSPAIDPNTVLPGTTVTVTVSYPYSINLLGWVISSGSLSSSMTDSVE